MEFSLSPVDSGGDVRMLKQCRPILELGDDRQEHSRSMKLSRTDSFSSARQQESNSSPSPDDHQSSSTLMGTDPHAGGMIYQQQYSSRPLFQQQQGSYSSPYTSIKQSSHFSSSPGFQQQQQQQQLHYFPFTASQWAELEHQALIFKYMMARAPVPPELVIPIRRSLILTPSPTNSWSGFQLGVGSGSPMDAEPGRCRRTDGKKWRCSRPVVVDQKYCERHMHRGRNRSRKAAEAAAAAAAVGTTANSTAATAAANTATSTANNGGAKSSAFSSSGNKGGGMAGMETGLGSYHYPLQTSHGDLASKDQRFVNGMSKAGFDPLRPEQLLFAEVSGSCTRPLGGSSASRLVHHQDIGSMHMFGSSPAQEHGLHGHMHRHSSSNSSKPSPLIRGIERKPEALRHFLDDDWPRVDDSTSIAAGFKTVPSSSSTGIFSLALDEEREQERDRGGAEDGHRHHQSDRSSQNEEQEEAYTHMSLATSGGSGDLLSELLLKSPKPPPLGNATKMVLASPTGVLQRLTCFSDSSSSASSPGSVKNDANHAQ